MITLQTCMCSSQVDTGQLAPHQLFALLLLLLLTCLEPILIACSRLVSADR